MVRRIAVWIAAASFLAAGLPAPASAELKRRQPADWIDDVIPAHQVKPGNPTPHSLIAMQAQAWAMRQTPKRAGFGSPFGLLPEWMDWDRMEARGIILSEASLENIAAHLGIDPDQIARIEGVDVPGHVYKIWPADNSPTFDQILVRVSLQDGTAYLGILDKEQRKYREPVYQVRSLFRADEGLTEKMRQQVADYLRIDPGRIQRVEVAVFLPPWRFDDAVPGGWPPSIRGMSIYLSVELDDGSRYLGQASGSYEWDIERPFPAPHEPITDISLPPDGEPIIWPIEPEPRIVPKIVIDEIYSLTEALAVAIPTDSHPDVANVHVIARYLGLHTDQIRSVQFVPDRRGFCHWHDWRHRAGRFTVLVETDKGEFLGVVTGRVQRDGRLRVKEILALNPAHDEWRGYFGRRTLRNIARYLGVSPREIASIQVAVVDPYYKLPVLIPDDPEVMPLRWPPRQLAVVVTLVDGTRFLGTLQLAGSWRGRWEPVYRVRILREIEPSYPDPWMPILRPPYPEPIGPIILPEVHRGAEGQEKQ